MKVRRLGRFGWYPILCDISGCYAWWNAMSLSPL